MAKGHKYYCVWEGSNIGVFSSWEECRDAVHGFPGAKYVSFKNEDEANNAFIKGYDFWKAAQEGKKQRKNIADIHSLPPEVDRNAIAVDAACSGNPGQMEYRGVRLTDGKEIFHYGPTLGTNNIGEFLAIVHALALLKKHGLSTTIYSDSKTAQKWVRIKECKTTLVRNEKTENLHNTIGRAVAWLHNNTFDNRIVKWNTEQWGEIPADFGRK